MAVTWWVFLWQTEHRGKAPPGHRAALEGRLGSLWCSVASAAPGTLELRPFAAALWRKMIPGLHSVLAGPLAPSLQEAHQVQERSVPSGLCTVISSRNVINDPAFFPFSLGGPPPLRGLYCSQRFSVTHKSLKGKCDLTRTVYSFYLI